MLRCFFERAMFIIDGDGGIPMARIQFVGEPPSANVPAVPMYTSIMRHAELFIHDGAWSYRDDEGFHTGVPSPATLMDLTYNPRVPPGRYVPIVLPPVDRMPVLDCLMFYNLPIASIDEIGNIDSYRQQMVSIQFHECPNLVFDDVTWFLQMPAIKGLHVDGCQLRSLRGLDQFPRHLSIDISRNNLELSANVGILENYWRRFGAKPRNNGNVCIAENLIGGKRVKVNVVNPRKKTLFQEGEQVSITFSSEDIVPIPLKG